MRQNSAIWKITEDKSRTTDIFNMKKAQRKRKKEKYPTEQQMLSCCRLLCQNSTRSRSFQDKPHLFWFFAAFWSGSCFTTKEFVLLFNWFCWRFICPIHAHPPYFTHAVASKINDDDFRNYWSKNVLTNLLRTRSVWIYSEKKWKLCKDVLPCSGKEAGTQPSCVSSFLLPAS